MKTESDVIIFIGENTRHELRVLKAVENFPNYNQTLKELLKVYKRSKKIDITLSNKSRLKENVSE